MANWPYFTLITADKFSDGDRGHWGIAFGDYDHDCVVDEKRDRQADYDGNQYRFKIIKTADDQASINAAVAAINKRS